MSGWFAPSSGGGLHVSVVANSKWNAKKAIQ